MIDLFKVIALLVLVYIIWNMLLSVLFEYLKAVRTLGAEKVKIIYRPFTSFMGLMSESETQYHHSHGYYHNIVRKYPETKLIFIKVLGITFIYVVDSEYVKTVSNKILTHLQRIVHMPFLNEVEKGLIFSTGEVWKKSRRTLSDLFHFEKLRVSENNIVQIVKRKTKGLDGKSPDLLQLGKQISSEVVLRMLLGEDFANVEFKSGESPFKTLEKYLEMTMNENLKMTYLLRAIVFGQVTRDSYFLTQTQSHIIKQIHIIKKIITDYVVEQQEKSKTSSDVSPFIKAYESHKEESVDEIVQQIFSFMIAGTDTTGGLLQSIICHLAAYPQYQSIILQDLKDDIHSSVELNNFINEVIRLRSTVQMGAPLTVCTPFELEKYTVSKGLNLVNCYAGVSYNPLNFDNPSQFNPNRYKQRNQSLSLWTPFGTGPRSCIGKHMALFEVRLTIVQILQQYKIQQVGTSFDMVTDFLVNVIKDKHFVKFIAK